MKWIRCPGGREFGDCITEGGGIWRKKGRKERKRLDAKVKLLLLLARLPLLFSAYQDAYSPRKGPLSFLSLLACFLAVGGGRVETLSASSFSLGAWRKGEEEKRGREGGRELTQFLESKKRRWETREGRREKSVILIWVAWEERKGRGGRGASLCERKRESFCLFFVWPLGIRERRREGLIE